MPDIGEMKYGTSESGVQNYIEEIRAEVLNTAATQLVEGVDEIAEVCNQHWEGVAKEKFVQNLRNDASHVASQYGRLCAILEEELRSLRGAMVQKDKSMFD